MLNGRLLCWSVWKNRRPGLRGSLQYRPLILLGLTICLLLTILDHATLRDSLYKAYAFPKIWLKSWQRPWRNYPANEAIYQGVRDCTPDSVSFLYTADSCTDLSGGQLHWFSPDSQRVCSQLPEPAIGSYKAVGQSVQSCVDRRARLGSYGLDANGHLAEGEEEDAFHTGVQASWARTDLAAVQRNCTQTSWRSSEPPLDRAPPVSSRSSDSKNHRTAVILRGWDGFTWTEDDIYNVRALVAELSLHTGGQYEVFLLLHVHNSTYALPTGGDELEQLKLRYVPSTLANMTELWNYLDCEIAYPAVREWDVYYHMFMSVQLFALRHPEFDFFWNWEMDVRYTGHYHTLFSELAEWSMAQTSEGLWERNTRFYISSVHGSYENFTEALVTESRVNDPATRPKRMISSVPGSNLDAPKEADLITLFPMFDVSNTLWPHKDYLVNYNAEEVAKIQTRYGTVGTNMRLSRGLVSLMHQENLAGRGMMSEMWPTTLAFHNGLKAVYAPHPVFMDLRWSGRELQDTFNAGPDGRVGGSLDTVINQEDSFDGSTWFWNSHFASDLYRRWLGLALDGPGSSKWESKHGMMCLPSILLHPVKASEFLSQRPSDTTIK